MEMEFTGERYVPSIDGQIKYEHLHRYALSIEFVKNKSVLDLASGEGYGAALLAKIAQEVIGVDIDPVSVDYAKIQYGHHQNLKFLMGSCDLVPLPDKSVDVVTSFETIEHHGQHEEMIREIKRVLKQDGVLIISTPNRLTYSDEPNYSNPYHVKELYYDEFVALLSQHFKYVKVYGQRLAIGSFVFPLNDSSETSFKAYTGHINILKQQVCSLESPIYFVAICSDETEPIRQPVDSIYIDRADDLLTGSQKAWQQTQRDLEQVQDQLQQTQRDLERVQDQLQQTQRDLERLQDQLQQTQRELEQAYKQEHETKEKLEQAYKQKHETQETLERVQSQLQQTQGELERSQKYGYEIKAELEQAQKHWQETQTELGRSQSQLQQAQEGWKEAQTQLQQAQGEWARSQILVQAMETSKFWKLRRVWFRIKKTIGLKVD
jgi:ubiquinone/menaquinone biosynthesis C-methylase UbiE/predicted  nucleic acid-binding Zn-ribbon protein